MHLIVRLFFQYFKNDKKVKRKMFIHGIHEAIILETDFDVFADIFKSIKNNYEELDNQMEGSELSFIFVSKLVIRCEKGGSRPLPFFDTVQIVPSNY